MSTKKKSPLADELKSKAYKTAANSIGATAQNIANKQTGIGAAAMRTANKETGLGAGAMRTVSKQTGIGAGAMRIANKQTGVGAGANRVVTNATNPRTGVSPQKTAAANAIGAQPRNAATAKPSAQSVATTVRTTTAAAPAQTPAVPYETDEQIRARYTQQLNDYDAQKRAEAERLRRQYNSQFNNAQRDNYIQYMQGHRELGEQLGRQGITGGMSETANLRDRLNYENRYAGMEGQRQSALQGVDNDYADALYNYRTQADANMNTELAENRQLRSEYEQKLQQQNEERFVNTLGAYDTPAKVEAAKRDAIAKGETWKIPYLNQQGTTLRQQAEATAQAQRERMEETFVNTIDRYDTVTKVDKAIKAARENGETWKIPYLSQHKASLKQQGKAETQAKQERKEQRFVNNIGGYDTVEKCDKAIKAARKSGETWKIPYLRQQKATLKQQGKAEKQAKSERYEQRYAATISGFNSVDAINKEIKKIRKSGKNTWKIAYLRARRTELINAGQTGSGGSGGSSGGSGKSSGKSGGGGGGGGADTPKQEETKPKKEKSVIERAEEVKKKKTKDAKKGAKKRVKQAVKKGGLLHDGRKSNTGTVTKPYYSQAGYANGYRYVR